MKFLISKIDAGYTELTDKIVSIQLLKMLMHFQFNATVVHVVFSIVVSVEC